MNSCVVFDLDDTLIDTKGFLLPDALRRTAEAAGVEVGRLDPGGKTAAEVLAGVPDLDEERRSAAETAWYAADVPPLEPLPGAREALAALRGRTHLYLLTRGAPERQRRKIERCGLSGYFDAVVVRPIDESGSKRDDLLAILSRHGLPPDRCAVVGDDPDDELRHAVELGCLAIPVPATPLAELPGRLEEAGLLGAGGSPAQALPGECR